MTDAVIIGAGTFAIADQDEGPRIALPQQDRAVIEKHLGKKVVRGPVAAPTIPAHQAP